MYTDSYIKNWLKFLDVYSKISDSIPFLFNIETVNIY